MCKERFTWEKDTEEVAINSSQQQHLLENPQTDCFEFTAQLCCKILLSLSAHFIFNQSFYNYSYTTISSLYLHSKRLQKYFYAIISLYKKSPPDAIPLFHANYMDQHQAQVLYYYQGPMSLRVQCSTIAVLRGTVFWPMISDSILGIYRSHFSSLEVRAPNCSTTATLSGTFTYQIFSNCSFSP